MRKDTESQEMHQDKEVEVLVLRDCGAGMGGEIVTLPAADAKAYYEQGAVDTDAAHIKAAKAAKEEAARNATKEPVSGDFS